MRRILRSFCAWLTAPPRSSWAWCPSCGHDLNGDDESFDGYASEVIVVYTCAKGGCGAEWDFDAQVPLLIRDRGEPS